MQIQIIQVPYDSGHTSASMGAGPEHFLSKWLGEASPGLMVLKLEFTVLKMKSVPHGTRTRIRVKSKSREAWQNNLNPL